MIKKTLVGCLALVVVFLSSAKFAQANQGMEEKELESFLFNDMDDVAGSIAKLSFKGAPAAVTTITAKDIAITPARKLTDLIEVYVPGALWFAHNVGSQPAIRGISSDRRTKFLMRVNGKILNTDTGAGIETELDMWDLRDIEKIEVIRGPGSVTYGPGAIGGVINIVTKNATTSPGVHAGWQSVPQYRSEGGYLSYGLKTDNIDWYAYSSITTTEGYGNPRSFRVTGVASGYSAPYAGYMGEDITTREASPYLKDSYNLPQLKFYSELNFLKEWRLWARFTRSGVVNSGFGPMSITPDNIVLPREQRLSRQATAVLENNHSLADNLRLKTTAGGVFTDLQGEGSTLSSVKRNSGLNAAHVSTRHFYLKSVLNIDFSENYSGAFGFSCDNTRYGKGWWDHWDNFNLGDISIVSTSASERTAATRIYTGKGWNMGMRSAFTEVNLGFLPQFTVLLSGRIDETDFSAPVFSPRVVVSSDWGKMGSTKLIMQKSIRTDSSDQLYIAERYGNKSDPETIKNIELIYDTPRMGNFEISLGTFGYQIENKGWDGTSASVINTSRGETIGTELEVKYTTDTTKLRVNHSCVDLVDYHLLPTVTASGMSYHEFNKVYTTGNVAYGGWGRDLNNWSKNTTKFSLTQDLPSLRLAFHTNMQIYWGFEGIYNAMDMVRARMSSLSAATQALVRTAVDEADSMGAGKPEFRLNMALSYSVTRNTKVTAWGMNLLNKNAKRYYYDSGNISLPYPTRVAWIEEPTIYGLKLDWSF